MEGDWPPSQKDIERMWQQIVDQQKMKKEKYTSKQWEEAHDDFVRCMMFPAEPFVVVQSIEGSGLPNPSTAAAPKAAVPLSVAPPAPASSENGVLALETIDLCDEEEEEEGASGGASSSLVELIEEENENETENEKGDEEQQQEQIEETASQQEIDDIQGVVGGTITSDDQPEEEEEEKNDGAGQAEGAAGWSEHVGAHKGPIVEGFSKAEICVIFNNLPKILTAEGKQALGLPERNPTNIMKSKKSRKKNKKRHD